MAGSKGSKYYDIFLKYKIFLSRNNKEIIDESVFMLLLAIKNEMSLSSAAEKLNISYRKAWGDIKKAEELLGYALTDRTRGGKEGGKSVLTADARKLLEAYAALQEKLDDAVEKAYQELKKKMEK